MLRGITHSLAYRIRNRATRNTITNLVSALLALPFILASIASVSCNGAGQTPAASHSNRPVQQAVYQQPHQTPRGSRGGATPATGSAQGISSSIGFRSRNQFDEHFAKHGAEFGQVTQQEYLRQAQTLRDEPAGGNVLEIRRPDGTVSRYDRTSGAFIAFNADGTIRTFFKPNNGEAYFRRQAMRSH